MVVLGNVIALEVLSFGLKDSSQRFSQKHWPLRGHVWGKVQVGVLGRGDSMMLNGGWTLHSLALPSPYLPKACAVQLEPVLKQPLLPGFASSLTNRSHKYREHSATEIKPKFKEQSLPDRMKPEAVSEHKHSCTFAQFTVHSEMYLNNSLFHCSQL